MSGSDDVKINDRRALREGDVGDQVIPPITPEVQALIDQLNALIAELNGRIVYLENNPPDPPGGYLEEIRDILAQAIATKESVDATGLVAETNARIAEVARRATEIFKDNSDQAAAAAQEAANEADAAKLAALDLLNQTGTIRDLAVIAKTSAETAAASAHTSATAASSSNTTATAAAAQAVASASGAATSAFNANQSATAAFNSEQSALTYSNAAETFAEAAEQSALTAESVRDFNTYAAGILGNPGFEYEKALIGITNRQPQGWTQGPTYAGGAEWNKLGFSIPNVAAVGEPIANGSYVCFGFRTLTTTPWAIGKDLKLTNATVLDVSVQVEFDSITLPSSITRNASTESYMAEDDVAFKLTCYNAAGAVISQTDRQKFSDTLSQYMKDHHGLSNATFTNGRRTLTWSFTLPAGTDVVHLEIVAFGRTPGVQLIGLIGSSTGNPNIRLDNFIATTDGVLQDITNDGLFALNQARASATSASNAQTYATDAQTYANASQTSSIASDVSRIASQTAAAAAATSATNAQSYADDAQAYSSVSQNNSLTANAYSQFAQYLDVAAGGSFTFEGSSLDGWTNHANTSISNPTTAALRVTHSGTNGYVKSPVINFNGAKYTKIRARIKILSGTFVDLSNVKLSYTTSSRASPTGHEMTPLAPTQITPVGGYVVAMWDINQTAESTEWLSHTIERLYLSMSPLSSFSYEIDYLYVLGESADAVLVHANAAITSAANASASESLAQSYATAATASSVAANTSAANALVSETAAATSATNAAGSASTATTQAGLATTAKNNAQTAATNAGISETNAATSATTATTAASTATTQATLSASSSLSAQRAANSIFPDNFVTNKDSWTDTGTGDPLTATTTTKSIVNDGTMGPSLQMTGATQTVYTKGVLPATAGRVYKIEIVGRATTNPTDGNGNLSVGVAGLDAAYANSVLVGSVLSTTITVVGGVVTLSAKFSDVAGTGILAWTAGKIWLRPYVSTNASESGTPVFAIKSVKITDITSEQAAFGSASNASVSETNAAISETNASGSAATALTQANLAANSQTIAQQTVNSIFPDNFVTNKNSWTDTNTGDPLTSTTTSKSIVADGTLGPSLQLTGVNQTVYAKGVLPATAGRVYKIEITGRATTNPTDANGTLSVGFAGLDAAYANAVQGGTVLSSTITVAGGAVILSAKFSDTAAAGILAWPAGKVWLRPYVNANFGEAGTPVFVIKSIKVTDVTSEQGAIISAANAAISETNAATSETNASGSAATALTQANLAANSAFNAQNVANSLFPNNFVVNKDAWSDTGTGDPSSLTTTSKSIVSDGTLGPALQINTIAGAFFSKGVVPATPGRVYRVEVVGRATVNPTDGTGSLYIGCTAMDAAYSNAANTSVNTAVTVAGGVVTFSRMFSDTADAPNGVTAWTASKVWLRFYVQANVGESGSPVFLVKSVTITDVTAQYNAVVSASNASVSETNAATSESNAASSAASALTQSNLAANSAFNAQNVANSLFPNNFATNKESWSDTNVGDPGTIATTIKPLVLDGTLGLALQINTIGGAFWTKGVLPATPGRVYKIEIVGRATINPTDGTGGLYLGVSGLDTSYASASNISVNTPVTVANGVITYSSMFSDTADAPNGVTAWPASKTWLRFYVQANPGEAGSPSFLVKSVTITDVTAQYNATVSAAAAAVSQTAAATSATNAAGSASTATTQATLAASSATQADLTALALFPADFTIGKSAWVHNTGAGTPASLQANILPWPIINDGTLGTSLEMAGNGLYLITKGVLSAVPGRVYKIVVVGRATANPTDGTGNIQIGLLANNASYVGIGQAQTQTNITVAGGVFTLSAKFSDVADAPNGITAWTAASVWMRPFIRTNNGEAGSPIVVIQSVTVTDVTSEQSSAISAAAAAISQSAAATSATNAAGSASTALTQANIAVSSAYDAQVAANSIFPDNFTSGASAWTDTATGDALTSVTTSKSIIADGTLGPALQMSGVPAAVFFKGLLPATAGRVYKLELVGRATTNPTDGTGNVEIGFIGLDAAFGTNTSATTTTNVTVAGGVVTISAKFSDTADAPNGITAWPAGKVWLRPRVRTNLSEAGSPVFLIKSFKVTDVTSEQGAIASASAASVSQTAAATSASNAAGSEAAASVSTVLAARLAHGSSITTNPVFQSWSGTYPDQYVIWSATGGTIAKETVGAIYGSNAVKMTATSANNLGIMISNNPAGLLPVPAAYVVIEVDIELVSGVITGSGVYFNWVNTVPTSYLVTIPTSSFTALGNNLYSLKRVVQRPPTWAGTFSYYQLILMANWSTFGYNNKTVIFHKASVRSATDEEIRTFNVTSEIDAAVTIEAGVRASADGTINARYGVKVDVNGHVSGFGLISTANNAAPFSEFVIAADKLKVAYPAGGVASGQQMFEVGLVNGVTKMVLKGDMVADNLIIKRNITANSIGVRELILTDRENLIPDGAFEEMVLLSEVWSITGTASLGTLSTAITGSKVAVLDRTAGINVNVVLQLVDFIPIRSGDTLAWRIAFAANAATANGMYYRILWYDNTKTALAGTNFTDVLANIATTTSFQTRLGNVAVPVGAKYAKVAVYWITQTSARYLYLDHISLRKAEGAELIVDGSLSAEKLTISSRGITVEGIEFSHNSPTSNKVAWTAGTIRYINSSKTVTSAAISANAGGTTWSSGVLYIYWVEGATSLSTTTTAATAFADGNLVLGTYKGGTDLIIDYGRTTIEGSRINAGSIAFADGTILTSAIGANAVSASVAASTSGSVTISPPSTGTLQSVTMTPVNGQVVITAGFEIPNTGNLTVTSTSGIRNVSIEILRASTVLQSFLVYQYVIDIINVSGTNSMKMGGQYTFTVIDTSPGNTSVTYTMQLVNNGDFGVLAQKRFITCINLKK